MKPLRMPIPEQVAESAREYARLSMAHTHNYNGWGDEHKKRERIETGRCAQLWVARFCQVNSILVRLDDTDHTRPDLTDVTIAGEDVDVKASTISIMPPQVNAAVVERSHRGHFCFTLIDEKLRWIVPLGFIRAADFARQAVCVRRGERIPGTQVEQRFADSSYFLPGDKPLMPFDVVVRAVRDGGWPAASGSATKSEREPCPTCNAPMDLTASQKHWHCHACSRRLSYGVYYTVWTVDAVAAAHGWNERRAS